MSNLTRMYFRIVGGVSLEYIPINGTARSEGIYIRSFITCYLTTIFEEPGVSGSKQASMD